jgi:hypothetical protein
MPADFSGGLDPNFEYFLSECPTQPEMRDSATLWLMDADGELAFPRVTIEASGGDWEHPWLQLNLVLSDGRALRVWDKFPRRPASGAVATSSELRAGPLRFECVEPFSRWTIAFEGSAEQSTTAKQMAGTRGGERVELAFHFDADMVASPWLMGGMTPEAARLMHSSVEGALMGGLRYEQLCRIRGFVRLDGLRRQIAGTGMRVRRQGVRNMAAATGHCQHSALFPSGRAFGAIAFAPRADGSPSFNEGFVIAADGGRHSARVIEAPWMTRLVSGDEAVPLVLETEIGTVRIEGRTLLSTFDRHLFEMADTSILQQAAVRYLWDGEEAIGLIERCTLRNRIEAV